MPNPPPHTRPELDYLRMYVVMTTMSSGSCSDCDVSGTGHAHCTQAPAQGVGVG